MSCRHCRSGQSVNKIPKLTIHNPTSPLLLFANLHTLKRLSAGTSSRFHLFSFSHHLLGFWLSCFLPLSRSVSVSHTIRTGELKQWKLQQTLRLWGPLHSQKRLRNLLQHDKKIFKPCFIVPRTVPPMLSEILSVKIQWMTPLMNETTFIKVLLSYNYSNCSLSS